MKLDPPKRMTLITAFPYVGGTVVSADSRETVKDERGYEFKYGVLKLEPERMGQFDVLIAGGGSGEAIDSFIESARQFVPASNPQSLNEFKTLIQSELKNFRRELKAVGDDTKMHLIIAARIDEEYEVWKTASFNLSRVRKPDMIGFTDYLYRHVARDLYSESYPVSQQILLSLRVLDFARQTCTCVDRPFSVVIVRKDGMFQLENEVIEEFVESLTLFGASINRLLLACADTHLRAKDFAIILNDFQDTARHLRNEYLQTMGAKMFLKALEAGIPSLPISFIPEGTIGRLNRTGFVEMFK